MLLKKSSVAGFITGIVMALASACAVVSCAPDLASAQVINPSQPATGVPTAGTGISVSGQQVSINYGLASQTYTGKIGSSASTAASAAQGTHFTGTLGFSDTGILGSFQDSQNSYLQFVAQNTNSGSTASAGFLVANNLSTATTYYGEFGINSSTFSGTGAFNLPNATYLTGTSGDLAIGTTTANGIHFAVNSAATDNLAISSTGVLSGTSLTTYEANVNHVQTVLNVAALRALSSCVPGLIYGDQGYYTSADGAAAQYVCNGSDTSSTDNGGTILATSGTGYRLYLIYGKSVNVRLFGSKCDGSTDDTTTTQAALTWAKSVNGAQIDFPQGTCVYAGTLSLSAATGVKLSGATSSGQTAGGATLKYTGTGSGTFLTVSGSSSFAIEKMNITYSSASFTGTLVATPTCGVVNIDQVSFFGNGASTAAYLLSLDSATDVMISRSYFQNAQYGILGQATSGSSYSNAVQLIGLTFGNLTVAAIRDPGQAWDISETDFENLANLTGNAITVDAACQSQGLNIHGSWFGDGSSATAYTWITWQGSGLHMTGNWLNGNGSNNVTGVSILGTSYGVDIQGNHFQSMLNAVNIGSFLVNDITYLSNDTHTSVTNSLTGTSVSALMRVKSGSWTPTWTNLTVVNGTGSATYAGIYQVVGNVVKWQVTITCTGTATTASTAGSTEITNLPFAPGTGTSSYDTLVAANASTSVGIGTGLTSGQNAFTPTWSATGNTIVISGTYMTAN